MSRFMGGLQVFDLELGLADVLAAAHAARDVIGRPDPVFGQDRPRLGPGAGREIIEAEAENAARRRDRHRPDAQVARRPAAHLIDPLLHHGRLLAHRRLQKGEGFGPLALLAKRGGPMVRASRNRTEMSTVAAAEPLSFQDLILTLHHYWSEQGCAILQPYDIEVGGGTLHPATGLRAVGKKPWKAAYVQPSRRPGDGRYGENPNRLQHYYQYQVILKPNPDNLQELYLNSLRAIGIDPSLHDIRFVEDDWENPTLGAWGLGRGGWCAATEVTHCTYFQRVRGLEVDVVSGALTYGLERLARHVQGVDNAYDLEFNKAGLAYGEVFLETERQQSEAKYR